MREKHRSSGKRQTGPVPFGFLAILKGSMTSIIITLIAFILFAVIIKVANLKEAVIPSTVQVIRTISIAVGGIISTGKNKKAGWIKGGISGVIYILAAFLISYPFGGSAFKSSLVVSDLLLGIVAGAVGGIIGVNI